MNTALPVNISKRKQSHLTVCNEQSVESRLSCGFEDLRFIHAALPELNAAAVDTSLEFLDKKISLPLLISCMTGGSQDGLRINQELAKAAEKRNIPFGLGSMRVLFDHPERLSDFQVRRFAPHIPLLANLGAVQLRDTAVYKIKELAASLEVDALVIHLNCGQELFQVGGDRDFVGLYDAIARATETLDIPIIVKETGFGIRPCAVRKLLEMGVMYVDVAGSGGTNWISVENHCHSLNEAAAKEFIDWGLATPILINAARSLGNRLIASGGLRTGMDLAKSIALGASLGGMALPFVKAVMLGGCEAALEQIDTVSMVVRTVMTLTGCSTIEQLKNAPLLKSSTFEHQVKTLQGIEFHP